MPLTGNAILMDTRLWRLRFPNWPGLASSKAPTPDEADRCGSCAHFPGECECSCCPELADLTMSIQGKASQ